MKEEKTIEAIKKLLSTMNTEDALLITLRDDGYRITYGRREEYVDEED